jgi:hypothetical protein
MLASRSFSNLLVTVGRNTVLVIAYIRSWVTDHFMRVALGAHRWGQWLLVAMAEVDAPWAGPARLE